MCPLQNLIKAQALCPIQALNGRDVGACHNRIEGEAPGLTSVASR